MNNRNVLIRIAATLLLISSLNLIGGSVENKNNKSGGLITSILAPIRTVKPFFFTKKGRLASNLYNAVYKDSDKWVKELLDDGADPDYCSGEAGWIDSNPLSVLVEGLYLTYIAIDNGKPKPVPESDIVILQHLITAGVDIHRRPYVWERVNSRNNDSYETIRQQNKVSGEPFDSKSMKIEFSKFVNDHNRLLEALIQSGADVDMKGHPYPFSFEGVKTPMNDKKAKKYFAKGTRPVNEAIKKGILWESQVDLLLQYTKLDEDSLKAADESGDPAMIKKISLLWEKQKNSQK